MTYDRPHARLTFRDDVRRNPLWGLVVIAGIVFVISCLAWVMAGLRTSSGAGPAASGSHTSPIARYLNEHGSLLIGIEVAVILVSGLMAMVVDRLQTLREHRAESRTSTS